ncbi:hypothetical protein GGR52DRAFT_585987 [Hypoxylon sp. FL1284]|nr:hypothetical protein GGR52DRAFT_585987 [Hypoxylon sp. FL1284]
MVRIRHVGALCAFAFASLAGAQNTTDDGLSADHWPWPHHHHKETETVTETETCYVYETTTLFSTINYTTTDEETTTTSVTVIDEETTTLITTYTSLVPTVTTDTFIVTTTIPTTVVSVSGSTQTTTEYSTSVYTTVSTYTTSVPYTFTDVVTTTFISVSASPTTNTATVTTTEATTSFVTLVSTSTFVTTSETTITDSEVSTATFTTTQVFTTVLPVTTTAPGAIVTAPQATVTVPPFTVTNIIIRPPVTATVTESPVTVTLVSDITSVSTCTVPPEPPSIDVPQYDPLSELTWGCNPGTICAPPKPLGCNIYAEPPAQDYVCESSSYCINAPLYYPVRWPQNQTSFYRTTPDYYNIPPPAFGLSYDIFAVTYVDTPSGTIETGNWGSQTSITEWPPSTTGSTTKAVAKRHPYAEYAKIGKRSGVMPPQCYSTCNDAYLEGQHTGKSEALCADDSLFRSYTKACQTCTEKTANWIDVIQGEWKPLFAQYLDYCMAHNPESIVPTAAQADVTSSPGGSTASGASPGVTSVVGTPSFSTSSTTTSSETSSTSESTTSEATTSSTSIPTSTSTIATTSNSTISSSTTRTITPPATVPGNGTYTATSTPPATITGNGASANSRISSGFLAVLMSFIFFI